VLNACQSGKLTADTEASVVAGCWKQAFNGRGHGYSVTVTAAALMMTELYRQLFKDQNLSRAVVLCQEGVA